MDYKTFEKALREELEKYYPIKESVIEKYGYGKINAFHIVTGSKFQPMIYPSFSYENFKNGMSVEKIVSDYLKTINNQSNELEWVNKLLENPKEEILKLVVPVLYYKPFFKDGVYENLEWSDDIVKAYLVKKENDESGATILIKDELMKKTDISFNELKTSAERNIENKVFYIEDIENTMISLLSGAKNNKIKISPSMERIDDLSNLYVVTVKDMIRGSNVLLREDILRDITVAFGKTFYILPSSLHEILVCPCDERMNVEMLKDMVRETNATQVDKSEWLSNNIYYFDGNKLKQC